MNFCSKLLRNNSEYLTYIKTKSVFKPSIEVLHPKLLYSYFPYITDEQLRALAIAYPDNVTKVREFIF